MAQIITGGIMLLGLVVCPNRASAQFTGDHQTNIISGTAINWPGYSAVGETNSYDAVFILNAGSLTNIGLCYIGHQPGANSNLLAVSGSGSAFVSGTLYVGGYGVGNRIVVSGGAVMNTGSPSVGLHSSYNTVLVTDSGSVWSNQNLYMGDGGAYNSMVISNGGVVRSLSGYVGGNVGGGQSNLAVVTGHGSVWTNRDRVNVGYMDGGNSLIVSNGGAVFGSDGIIGAIDFNKNAGNNSVLVTGSGSTWRSTAALVVGWGFSTGNGATNNQLTIANSGLVLASSAVVGALPNASNCLINVSGGALTVTNLSGSGTIDVRRGRLVFDGGTITAERLWLTNGVSSILEFNSGTLHSRGTVISNAQPFAVGDAIASGTFHLLGGLHTFQAELRIRTNSFLTGCGTVTGSVVVDAGGAVHANCTNLVFNSSVTNNGAMVVDGAVMETFDTFVNNGKIFLINGGATNFHGTFINNGEILNGDTQLHIERNVGGVLIRHFGVPALAYRLQRAASVTGPWFDIATNTAPASGLIEYHETTSLPAPAFYRSIQP